MTKILIHAGFHKTGTSTVQRAIGVNRRALSQHIRPYLKDDFEAVVDAARVFSEKSKPGTLTHVLEEAKTFFEGLDIDDPRPIFVSSEGLSGLMPGRRSLERYKATPYLMSAIANAAVERFGDQMDLSFYFSTRDRTAWLRSCWWQNLRSSRMTLDFDVFCQQVESATDMETILKDTEISVAPCSVFSADLELLSELKYGPLTPVLDLLEVPATTRARLKMPKRINQRPRGGIEAVLLELNRSDLNDEELSEAKVNLRSIWNRDARDEPEQDETHV